MFEFSKDIAFELIFLLQLVTQSFLRQRLMIMSTEFVAKNSLMLLFIAYWAIHYTNLFENDQLIQLLNNSITVFSWLIFWKSTCFWNVVDTMYSDWFLVNFIEREFFIVFLILNCIQTKFDHVFLLKSSWNFLTKMFCFYWNHRSISSRCFWCFDLKMKRSKSLFSRRFFRYDLNVENLLCMKVSTNDANFFNRFDVFDRWLLLWIVENLKRLTFVSWKHQRNWMIEITCVNSLYWDSLFLLFLTFQVRIRFLDWTM